MSGERRTFTERGADGRTTERHALGCGCTRCRGFTPGPEGTATTAPMRHGAYAAPLALAGRAEEIADGVRSTMQREDIYRPSFDPMIQTLAVTLVRVERATAALTAVEAGLDEGDAGPLASYFRGATAEGKTAHEATMRLRHDLRSWINTSRALANDLGLTPRALAAISRDTGIGRATRASAAIRALDEHLEAEYGDRRELTP